MGNSRQNVTGGVSKTTSRDAATAFLEECLASGSKPAREVFAEAAGRGIAERTLKRAKRELGVQSLKEGFGDGSRWVWERIGPVETPPMAEISNDLLELRAEAALHLDRIGELFKPPIRLTLLVRSPDLADGDFLLTDDDLDAAVKAIRRLQLRPEIPPDQGARR